MSPMRAATLCARLNPRSTDPGHVQRDALQECALRRGWTAQRETVEEITSGAKDNRPKRQALLKAATQRKLDVILVWKLDRWGRSLVDLMMTLRELTHVQGVRLNHPIFAREERPALSEPALRYDAEGEATTGGASWPLLCSRFIPWHICP